MHLDHSNLLARYFLPYQLNWIEAEAPFHQQRRPVFALAEPDTGPTAHGDGICRTRCMHSPKLTACASVAMQINQNKGKPAASAISMPEVGCRSKFFPQNLTATRENRPSYGPYYIGRCTSAALRPLVLWSMVSWTVRRI